MKLRRQKSITILIRLAVNYTAANTISTAGIRQYFHTIIRVFLQTMQNGLTRRSNHGILRALICQRRNILSLNEIRT